jgi:hypothetical protein
MIQLPGQIVIGSQENRYENEPLLLRTKIWAAIRTRLTHLVRWPNKVQELKVSAESDSRGKSIYCSVSQGASSPLSETECSNRKRIPFLIFKSSISWFDFARIWTEYCYIQCTAASMNSTVNSTNCQYTANTETWIKCLTQFTSNECLLVWSSS